MLQFTTTSNVFVNIQIAVTQLDAIHAKLCNSMEHVGAYLRFQTERAIPGFGILLFDLIQEGTTNQQRNFFRS